MLNCRFSFAFRKLVIEDESMNQILVGQVGNQFVLKVIADDDDDDDDNDDDDDDDDDIDDNDDNDDDDDNGEDDDDGDYDNTRKKGWVLSNICQVLEECF